MKRFLIISAVLAVSFVAVWINVLPVRCTGCDCIVFRTDIASSLFGGHGDVTHLGCLYVVPEHRVPSAVAHTELEAPAEGSATES